MKRNLCYTIILGLLLSSCEKVIDINLNEANSKIVIEASIHNNAPCFANVTRTGDFFSPYTPQHVSGAKITLSNQFTKYAFTETKNSNYRLDKIGKLIPTAYTLKVEIDGELYEAVSQMPATVNLTYLISEYEEKSIFQEAGYNVYFGFKDPADDENFYRVKYYINGELQNRNNDYFIITDELFNGKSIQMQLYGKHFDKGDTVSLELMSIDKNTYDYINTLIVILRQEAMDSAAPANPKSNFTNGALGYFSAYSSDIKTIIIGEPSKNY